MLSVKQDSIKYDFLSLWYDSTWDWTQISRAIGEHSDHYANIRCKLIYKQINKYIYVCANIFTRPLEHEEGMTQDQF